MQKYVDRDWIHPNRRSLREILADVSVEYGVSLLELHSRKKSRKIAHARQAFMALAYATGRYSTTQVGRFVDRDHTTVLHAIKAHAQRVAAT